MLVKHSVFYFVDLMVAESVKCGSSYRDVTGEKHFKRLINWQILEVLFMTFSAIVTWGLRSYVHQALQCVVQDTATKVLLYVEVLNLSDFVQNKIGTFFIDTLTSAIYVKIIVVKVTPSWTNLLCTNKTNSIYKHHKTLYYKKIILSPNTIVSHNTPHPQPNQL